MLRCRHQTNRGCPFWLLVSGYHCCSGLYWDHIYFLGDDHIPPLSTPAASSWGAFAQHSHQWASGGPLRLARGPKAYVLRCCVPSAYYCTGVGGRRKSRVAFHPSLHSIHHRTALDSGCPCCTCRKSRLQIFGPLLNLLLK